MQVCLCVHSWYQTSFDLLGVGSVCPGPDSECHIKTLQNLPPDVKFYWNGENQSIRATKHSVNPLFPMCLRPGDQPCDKRWYSGKRWLIFYFSFRLFNETTLGPVERILVRAQVRYLVISPANSILGNTKKITTRIFILPCIYARGVVANGLRKLLKKRENMGIGNESRWRGEILASRYFWGGSFERMQMLSRCTKVNSNKSGTWDLPNSYNRVPKTNPTAEVPVSSMTTVRIYTNEKLESCPFRFALIRPGPCSKFSAKSLGWPVHCLMDNGPP